MNVLIKKTNPSAKVPQYQKPGDAGADLCACLEKTLIIYPGEYKLVPTGISLQMQEGLEAQVRSRSGLAVKNGVSVLNSPGTIDSSYTGEVGVVLINSGNHKFEINNGDRIAQLVFAKVEKVSFIETNQLIETERGSGGFGSTGVA